MNDHELYSTVVVRQATTPIRLGDDLLGGKICAASVGNLVEANIDLEAERERLADERDQLRAMLAAYKAISPYRIRRLKAVTKERDALAAENARLRAELEQSRDLIVEMSKHCNATALVDDWLESNQ